MRRLTTEEFVKRAKKIHGDKYNYKKVRYMDDRTKVEIICRKHGLFFQSPGHHAKRGQGCPECGNNKISISKTSNTFVFIKKSKELHGEIYDYSNVVYKNNITEVEIICRKHGKFKQRASDHLSGKGCNCCGNEKISIKNRSNKEDFIKKSIEIHGSKYDYNKVIYKNNYDKLIINCPIHGEFRQSARDHLRGSGCYWCGKIIAHNKTRKTKEQFILDAKKIHGNKYGYEKVDYIDYQTKVRIICKKHGEFDQFPGDHLQDHGCPFCRKKNEGKVKDLLSKYFKDWNIIPHKKIWDKYKSYNHRRHCDFWLEKNNIKIMVEYDGEQHYRHVCFNGISIKKAEKNFKKTQIKDQLDTQFCKENNIVLHRIKYDENKEESIRDLLEFVCE